MLRDPAQDPLFRPLGRRARYSSGREPVVPRMERLRFTPRRLSALVRLVQWLGVLAQLVAGVVYDQLCGRRSQADVGRRLREAFERAGGTFAKIGQQLGNRVDLVPYPVCQELSRLFDRMPSFPLEQAVAAIEGACGRPIGEVFSSFDPEPIGSASIACVYQAVLQSGEQVAVKVRRPGIGQRFADDLLALDWLAGAAEALTIVRPGLTRMLRLDLKTMLMEELDFTMEARFAELYRRQAKEDKVKFTTAPRIYHPLSNAEVIVEEFVSGVFLSEVLEACEANDQAELARLAEQGIRPKQVARRLLSANYWSGFEGLLFHADPHPANIIVRPGGTLVFIDFGACGPPSARLRRINWEILSRLASNDVSGAARIAMSMLEPLPHVDVDYLQKRTEQTFWRFFYAVRSKHAAWWERTTAGLWLSLLETTRELQLSVTMDTLRNLRASLLYDTLAARLWPDIDDRVFRRYMRKRTRRQAKRVVRRLGATSPSERTAWLVTQVDELARTGNDLLDRVRGFTEHPPSRFIQAASKASYMLLNLLSLGAKAVAPVLALMALQAASTWRPGALPALWPTAERVLLHPAYLTYLAFLLLFTYRRLQFRFSDTEPD